MSFFPFIKLVSFSPLELVPFPPFIKLVPCPPFGINNICPDDPSKYYKIISFYDFQYFQIIKNFKDKIRCEQQCFGFAPASLRSQKCNLNGNLIIKLGYFSVLVYVMALVEVLDFSSLMDLSSRYLAML